MHSAPTHSNAQELHHSGTWQVTHHKHAGRQSIEQASCCRTHQLCAVCAHADDAQPHFAALPDAVGSITRYVGILIAGAEVVVIRDELWCQQAVMCQAQGAGSVIMGDSGAAAGSAGHHQALCCAVLSVGTVLPSASLLKGCMQGCRMHHVQLLTHMVGDKQLHWAC